MNVLSEGYFLSVVEKDKRLENLERDEQNAVAKLLAEQTLGLRGLLRDAQRELATWIEFNKDLKKNLRKASGTGEADCEEY